MTELQARPELWRRPATRVVAAGGRNWRIAVTSLQGLREASAEIVQHPHREEDGSVALTRRDADLKAMATPARSQASRATHADDEQIG